MSNEGTFSVIRAKRGGKDAVIVVDGKLDADRWAQAFPWLVTITLPIRRPNDAGLCDDAESERLGKVEDQLLDAIDINDYRYVGRITWNGTREVLFYTTDPDEAIERLRGAPAGLKEAVELDSELEPGWDTYRMLIRPLR